MISCGLWVALVLFFLLPSTLCIPCGTLLRNAEVTQLATSRECLTLLSLEHGVDNLSLVHQVSHKYTTVLSAFWPQLFHALYSKLQRIIHPSGFRPPELEWLLHENCYSIANVEDGRERYLICRTGHSTFKPESDIRSSCSDFAYTPAIFQILRFDCSSVSGQDLEKRLAYPTRTACFGNCKLHHALNCLGSGSGGPDILQSGVRLETITLEFGLISLSASLAGTVFLNPAVPWIILPRSLVSEFCE
ncbi:hypothetical protein BDV93DRAFT_29591 [Ceratobasidium sp. AG-I]|nr:hypothetical protein BDV93DRAFT_29591 [Ceratobasidium sp. AG-I]